MNDPVQHTQGTNETWPQIKSKLEIKNSMFYLILIKKLILESTDKKEAG